MFKMHNLCLGVALAVLVVVTSAHHRQPVVNVYTSGYARSAELKDHSECTCEMEGRKRGVVAFSVGRRASFTSSVLTRIEMDHEFYNKGGYFDMETSIFTAPVSGLYAFYFGASGHPRKRIYLFLYVGNPEKAVASTYNYNIAAHGHASGSVIIEMKKGDHASMWINKGMTVNQQTPPSTHFHGHLLVDPDDY